MLILLQVRLWIGDGSITQVRALSKEVALQQEKVEKLKERNQTLEAEVQDLKHRLHALEERARTDLGMIRQGETFYQYSLKGE
ncbi:MAG: hypothetical protein BGO43_11415 [Gammaproteobacteria bacterium 39-13]|nr:septum formation initiator family protein [Gammaproteobacteria bacterium]OJV85351.1 MAG: hypothetical protein BGO43_11415 [Gammaproteobacteria bacterium 39-13]